MRRIVYSVSSRRRVYPSRSLSDADSSFSRRSRPPCLLSDQTTGEKKSRAITIGGTRVYSTSIIRQARRRRKSYFRTRREAPLPKNKRGKKKEIKAGESLKNKKDESIYAKPSALLCYTCVKCVDRFFFSSIYFLILSVGQSAVIFRYV